jgi:hypothetical protein
MTKIRQRSANNSPVNNERCHVISTTVNWDESIDRFEVFRNNAEGHYGQSATGYYLFYSDFQAAYLERGTDCYVDCLDEVPSASQIKKDTCTLYGALLSAFQGGVEQRILMEDRLKQDGIQSWYQLVSQYETESKQNVRIKKFENVIATVYHRYCL